MVPAAIFFALVALFWLAILLLPSQRSAPRFVYDAATDPSATDGLIARDDVQPPYHGDPDPWPRVTAIVPGRNEGHLLPRTLGSLCAMDYPALHVVFVDDQSTDATPAACRALEQTYPERLTVLHNTVDPPPGWVGKTWAIHQARAYAESGDLLLFTDSDLEYHPQCLSQMVRLAQHRRAAIVSLLPTLRYETLGELLGLLPATVLITLGMPLRKANDPNDPRALIAGGFFLIERETYRSLGGHESVRGQVIEDVAFGRRAKAAGKRVYTVGTHDLLTARMYEGFRDTYRGLKKNAYAGVNYHVPQALGVAALLLAAGALVPLYAASGIALAVRFGTPAAVITAVAGVTAVVAQYLAGRRGARILGMPPHTGWMMAPGLAFYALVLLASMLDHYRGGNIWAGRAMPRKSVRRLSDSANPLDAERR